MDLLSRYSNHEAQLDTLLELLERLTAGDQTAAPGLPAAQPRVTPDPSRRKVLERLAEDAIPTMIDKYRAGGTILAVAEGFGIGESSVKRILRRHGVRRGG